MVLDGNDPEVLERFQQELEIVEINARQFHRVVCNLVELDDLRSAGREGLFDAARRFDPARDSTFRSYANIRVRGALFDHCRKASALPRRAYKRLVALEAALDMRGDGRGVIVAGPEGPRDEAEAEETLGELTTARATAAALALVSADSRVGSGSHELEAVSPEEAYINAELYAAVDRELVALELEREAEIVRLHYFESLTIDAIAERFGVDPSWASRLHRRAITRLSKRVRLST